MSSPSPVLSAQKRAWQYWFADGLAMIVAGIGCLLGAIFFAYDRSRDATPFTIALCFTALFFYGALVFFQRQFIDWLKTKITYPRTGYARLPHFDEEIAEPMEVLAISSKAADAATPAEIERLRAHRYLRLVPVIVMFGMTFAALTYIQNRWTCALAGIFMSFALWVWTRNDQKLSLLILGGFPFMGFFLAMVINPGTPGAGRVIYFLVGAGIIFILDGTLTLVQYLRANPRPRTTEP